MPIIAPISQVRAPTMLLLPILSLSECVSHFKSIAVAKV
jgi:hypothetical protein